MMLALKRKKNKTVLSADHIMDSSCKAPFFFYIVFPNNSKKLNKISGSEKVTQHTRSVGKEKIPNENMKIYPSFFCALSVLFFSV